MTAALDISAGTASAYRIEQIQRMAREGRWRTEAMRSLPHPVLYWFTRGQGRITVQGVTRGYGAHNAVFLPTGVMHGFEMLGHVYGNALHLPADADLGLPEEPLHLRLRDARPQAELTVQLENIQRELDLRENSLPRALVHHGGLLAVWLERQAGLAPPDPAGIRAADRLAAAFTALVERNFRSGMGVADYAAQLGVTATHLSRSCRAASGRPASALLQDRLHYEARRLLRETRTPVKDIARQLGFRSAAYFTRAFHAQTGSTPSTFRRAD